MDTTHNSNVATKPVRHIAVTGITAKSCRKIKMLLKSTRYYCLVDCYKKSNVQEIGETFYLPDYAILDVRSVAALFFLHKRIESIKELIPGIKIILYYNMLKRYPLLQRRNKLYAEVYAADDEQKQVNSLEAALQNRK